MVQGCSSSQEDELLEYEKPLFYHQPTFTEPPCILAAKSFRCIILFLTPSTLCGRYYCDPHFTGEQVRAGRGQTSSPSSQPKWQSQNANPKLRVTTTIPTACWTDIMDTGPQGSLWTETPAPPEWPPFWGSSTSATPLGFGVHSASFSSEDNAHSVR